MSIHSSNLLNNNYNIDKLNFNKIKKELETIPKIIKNHNRLKSCFSATDFYNNEENNSNNNLNDYDLFIKNEYNQNKNNSLSYKKSSPFNNLKNIYKKNNINNYFTDDIIVKIKKENKKEINNIKNLYERKIKEITLLYENKFINMNNLLKNNLNEYKLLSTDYIKISEHKNIINELKHNFSELLNKTKENYQKLINKLTDIMKNKSKYQDLIHRLQLYTIYEVEISEIEKKLVSNLNEKINNNQYKNNKYNYFFNDFQLMSQLDEDINYHKKICELKQIYNEKLNELKINQNYKINNLINKVKYIYDNYSYFSPNKSLNSSKIYNNKDNDVDKNIKLKNKSNKKENENEIIDFSQYKENECKSITNSEKSLENINLSSSKELANLLNIDTSNENHLKPDIMEINLKNYH